MWRNAGILRNGPRLSETVEIINMWSKYVLDKLFDAPFGWEVQNMLTTALLVSVAALQRGESRGVHYRTDHPHPDDAAWKSHLRIQRQDGQLQLLQARMD